RVRPAAPSTRCEMRRLYGWTFLALAALATQASAQDARLEAGLRVARLVAEPAELTLEAGGTARISIEALDAEGNAVDAQLRIVARGVSYDAGSVTASEGGEGAVIASVVLPAEADMEPPSISVPVRVTWPRVSRVDVRPLQPLTPYAGTVMRFTATGFFADGREHPEATFAWTTSDPAVARVDARGNVHALAPGRVTISADSDGTRGSTTVDVPAMPITDLEIRGGAPEARQGDVLTFEAVGTGPAGPVDDLPVAWAVSYQPDDTIKAPGAAGIVVDGKFVGEAPGLYTIVATAGDHAA